MKDLRNKEVFTGFSKYFRLKNPDFIITDKQLEYFASNYIGTINMLLNRYAGSCRDRTLLFIKFLRTMSPFYALYPISKLLKDTSMLSKMIVSVQEAYTIAQSTGDKRLLKHLNRVTGHNRKLPDEKINDVKVLILTKYGRKITYRRRYFYNLRSKKLVPYTLVTSDDLIKSVAERMIDKKIIRDLRGFIEANKDLYRTTSSKKVVLMKLLTIVEKILHDYIYECLIDGDRLIFGKSRKFTWGIYDSDYKTDKYVNFHSSGRIYSFMILPYTEYRIRLRSMVRKKFEELVKKGKNFHICV